MRRDYSLIPRELIGKIGLLRVGLLRVCSMGALPTSDKNANNTQRFGKDSPGPAMYANGDGNRTMATQSKVWADKARPSTGPRMGTVEHLL